MFGAKAQDRRRLNLFSDWIAALRFFTRRSYTFDFSGYSIYGRLGSAPGLDVRDCPLPLKFQKLGQYREGAIIIVFWAVAGT